ncbi:melanocyte-stimulating hormone receptor-like [Porites lutea]|uniref:melanocyte-stimulating hormone receptor-like n=1 Tax=Porites lutea TaxID=51062 RepID=UPI003CC5BF06
MNKTGKACLLLSDISFDKVEELFVTNILTCILNLSFGFVTFVANSTILLAIKNTCDLHTPSFVLLGSLAATDLLVGLVCQPLFVAFKIAELERNLNAYCWLRLLQSRTAWTTSGVSFLTVAAVSVDRLLALTLHLRYDTLVTVPRVLQVTFLFWILSMILNVVLTFWMTNVWLFFPMVIFFLTFIVITISTLKIFRTVLRHQHQINDQNAAVSHLQNNTVNVLKCRKSAVTVLYVYGLFVICFVPYIATSIIEVLLGSTTKVLIAYDLCETAIYINSFLNPIVYCLRIRKMRRAVKNILKRQ